MVTERHGCDEVTNPIVHQFADVSHESKCHQSAVPWQCSVPYAFSALALFREGRLIKDLLDGLN